MIGLDLLGIVPDEDDHTTRNVIIVFVALSLGLLLWPWKKR